MLMPVYLHSKPVSDYTLKKMTQLSQPPENMNSIQEEYGIVGTAPVTSLVVNHWDTGRLWLSELRTSEVK